MPVAVFATGCFWLPCCSFAALRDGTIDFIRGPHKYQRYHLMPRKIMTKTKLPYAVTLRLPNSMADDIEDIAYTLNLTRAAFVRRSIRRAIEHARQHELPLLDKNVMEAIRP